MSKGFRAFKPEPDSAAVYDFTRRLGDPLVDLSPNGNDLTLSGDVVRIADGPFGWSYDLPGSDDYLITSGNPASLRITGELTVEVIYKADVVNKAVLSKYDVGDGNRSWQFGWDGAGSIFAAVSADGASVVATDVIDDAVAPAGQVIYAAFTFKPSTYIRLFINGNLVTDTTSSVPASIYDSDQDVVLGGYMSSDTLTADFDGKFYCVRITPRAKSVQEIRLAGGRAF